MVNHVMSAEVRVLMSLFLTINNTYSTLMNERHARSFKHGSCRAKCYRVIPSVESRKQKNDLDEIKIISEKFI